MDERLPGGSDEGDPAAQVHVLLEPLAVLSFEACAVLPFLNVLAPPLLFEAVESPLECLTSVVEAAVPAERVRLEEEGILGDCEVLLRHAVEDCCRKGAALVEVAADLNQPLSQDVEAGPEDRGDKISRSSTVHLAGERPLAMLMQRARGERACSMKGCRGGDRGAR